MEKILAYKVTAYRHDPYREKSWIQLEKPKPFENRDVEKLELTYKPFIERLKKEGLIKICR